MVSSGHVQSEEREDEELVPEDVAPVGLAVPAAGGDADVEVDGVFRRGLQQVEHVQVEDATRFLVGLGLELKASPQVLPREHMSAEHVLERAQQGEVLASLEPRFADGAVAR